MAAGAATAAAGATHSYRYPRPIQTVLQLPSWVSPVAPGTLASQGITIDQPTLLAAIVSALATPYAPVGADPTYPGDLV